MSSRSRRHRAQSGTTLVELLVSIVLMGLALTILIGLFSSGALESVLSKRDASAQAATEYELDKVGAAQYSSNPSPYSECFASDGTSPTVVAYQGTCPSSSNIRADVGVTQAGNLQQWTIVINAWPGASAIGKPVSTYKVNR
jgi:Tfp pilus assembly protein PilV